MAIDKKTFVGVFDSTNVNKFYNIYTSDATISELKEMAALPADALIISSPIYSDPETKTSYDLGTPALVMTDSYGNPLTLTYTFAQGIFKFNENTNTVNIVDTESLKEELNKFKKEVEEIKNSLGGTVEYKFKQLCSSKAILNNGDKTSTVSFIDNTTYSLKLEKWTNQTLSAYESSVSDIIIPGPQNLMNSYYIFGYYNNNTIECSTCLGYWFKNASSLELVKKSYAGINNNCIDYINNYSLMNKFNGGRYGNNFLSVYSNTTGIYMNNIVGVGDSAKYIVTKPIYGGNNERVGAYTFLRFPIETIPNGNVKKIQLQVSEGNKCIASNTCDFTINWKWDHNDLPTTSVPTTTVMPTTPYPTPVQTTTEPPTT